MEHDDIAARPKKTPARKLTKNSDGRHDESERLRSDAVMSGTSEEDTLHFQRQGPLHLGQQYSGNGSTFDHQAERKGKDTPNFIK